MSRYSRPRSVRTLSSKPAAVFMMAGLLFGTASAQGPPGEGELRLGRLQPNGQGALQASVELSRLPSGLSGIQFDLVMAGPELRVEGQLSPAIKQSGKFLYLRPLGPGVYRLLIAGFNQGSIEAGAVATLTLRGLARSAPGTQLLSIRRVIGTDNQGRRLDFTVAVDTERPAGGDREKRSRLPHR